MGDANECGAWVVLGAFQHYGVGPGDGLLTQYVEAFAWNCGWSISKAKVAIARAIRRKVVTKAPRGPLFLTDAGMRTIVAQY